MTTKPQSTTEETLEPCPLSHYVYAGLRAHKTGVDPRIVCLDCGLTLRAPDWIKVYERWQSRTRTSPTSTAPVVDNVGLNLLRQLVGGKNSLRTLGVFPCNQAEHEDVDCECFWEQYEAWARGDAGVVDRLLCAKCGKPREGVSAESFLCRYCFSTESTAAAATAAPQGDNLQRRLYEECVTANWDPERKNTFPEEIAHLHEELSEAFRAWRKYKDCEVREVNGKLEGVPIEFADALIGMFYNAELHGFDLLAAIEQKHQFNLTRNYVAEGRQLHAPAAVDTDEILRHMRDVPAAATAAPVEKENG